MTAPRDDMTDPTRPVAQGSADDSGSPPPAVIRSDRVRYPGVDALPSPDNPYTRPDGAPRRLRPARDVGISVERRRARDRRKADAARRNRWILVALAAVALLLAGIAWRWASDARAARELVPTRARAAGIPVLSPATQQPLATPYFASYKNLKLRLPVTPADLTELGFHQASYGYALALKTPLPDADMKAAKKEQTTHRDLASQSESADATLTGTALRMWRNRPGKPNTAVDVGADPGTTILAPVSGTVLLVKDYKLYGRYTDVQVHIRPDASADVDVVLIHLKKPAVKAGDRVVAGITSIGVVRKFSDKMNLQLEHYTKKSGDHVHLQLNDVNDPSYKGLEDVDDQGGS